MSDLIFSLGDSILPQLEWLALVRRSSAMDKTRKVIEATHFDLFMSQPASRPTLTNDCQLIVRLQA